MVVIGTIAFLVAVLMGVLIVRADIAHHYGDDKPQRFHVGQVPRLGGLAVGVAMCAAVLSVAALEWWGVSLNVKWHVTHVLSVLVVLAPAVLIGLVEDVTQRLPVRYRLLATTISAVLAILLLDLKVPRLGLEGLDWLLQIIPGLGIFIALLAVAGLPHAFNIIDGYNGLAGTVAVGVCAALAYVALQVGDRALAAWLVALAGGTVGFLLWNYPKGLIFAGDGGAYLWGVMIAVSSVLLVQRNPLVSPWFPVLLLIYPVWETLFSMYRKWARGTSPSMADALHFHQLIYRRLVRGVFHDDHARQMLMRNNRTSPYLWSFVVLTALPAILFWRNSWVLMFFCLLFIVSYVVAYLAIIRFKVPGWAQNFSTRKKRRKSRTPPP